MNIRVGIILFIVLVGLSSCQAQPEPIQYGSDLCHNCKMTLMDEKFGCELITKKGKVFKFDDVVCLLRYLQAGTTAKQDISQLVVVNFGKKGEMLSVEKAFFLVSDHIQSPMGSNTAAFATREDAHRNNAESSGVIKSWKELEKTKF